MRLEKQNKLFQTVELKVKVYVYRPISASQLVHKLYATHEEVLYSSFTDSDLFQFTSTPGEHTAHATAKSSNACSVT